MEKYRKKIKCEFGQKTSRDFNAKTNCYLCLASIVSDNQIKCEYEDVLFPAINVPVRFSLQSICRYLNIKLTNDLIVNADNLSVTLCKKCDSVSSKLSDLCKELELLQMKVDHSLQIFCDAMSETKSEPFEAEYIYVNPMEDLRRKIKKQCHVKLNSVLPKVLIKEEAQISQEKFLLNTKKFPQAPESTLFDNDDDDEQPEREDNANIEQISTEIIPKHQIQLNTDSLMTHYKLPNVSPEDFKIYCDHIFKVEAISSKKISDSETVIFNCSYCPFTVSNHEFLTVHLYSNHKEIITKKLTELQKSSTVDEITSFQLPSLASSPSSPPPPAQRKQNSKDLNSNVWNKYLCTLCHPNVKFSQDVLLQKHRIRVHVDDLLKAHKSPNISQNDFKSYCAHILKVEAISSQKGRNAKGSPIFYCLYCKKPMVPEFLKIHLYLKHKAIVTKKLVELQKSTSFDELTAVKLPPVKIGRYQRSHNECDICGKIYSHSSNLIKHKKFYCKGTDKIQKQQNRIRHSKCHDCGKIFTDPSNLSKHKKLNCKKTEDKIRIKQIRNRYNKCHVCGKVYSDPSNLLRHQKTVHRLFKTSRNKVPSIAKTIKTEPPIDLDEGEGHQDDLTGPSEDVEEEDGLESEEKGEYFEDEDELEQMVVEKERDEISVKREYFNANSHVGVINPDNDPLQF